MHNNLKDKKWGTKVYKITIERTFEKAFPASTEYQRIKGNPGDGWKEGSDEYAYVPKPAYCKEVTETVFCQSVADLDMKKVVAACNGCELIIKKKKEVKP